MEKEMLKENDEPPLTSEGSCQSILTADRMAEGTLFKNDSLIRQLWPNVTPEQWNDWRWQMANRLRTVDQLIELLNLKPYQVSKYRRLLEAFPYAVTPYYFSLIDWFNPEDPIRKQCLPDIKELEYQVVGDTDPLEEEEDMQAPGLVHRYPDRVLAVVTNVCSMNCRHCTRKRVWRGGEAACSKLDLLKMLEYVRATSEIREVIVSGGDPLTMNLDLLDWFLGELQRISHVEVLRIGTRVPVVLPMRITDDLVRMLAKHRPLWVNVQFNHPVEITPESREACDKILRAGIPLSNQSVLLRGVNDTVEIMRDLCHELQRIMVRPYYLYQCDPVKGVEHFRTNVWKGVQIIEMMRGYTGGLCIPTFVVDAPGGGGKIPLQPFYLLSATEHDVLLRNYEGMIINYHNPHELDLERARRQNGNGKEGGTANLIRGNDKALVPEKTPRYRRRSQKKSLLKFKGDGNADRPDL
jgi:lysine 2,3-aminomutase